ncbi:MAG: hypothetical protein INR71_03920 [Terriglobus roseus]|nr:hypothetical protein [Terriglobus roseus]
MSKDLLIDLDSFYAPATQQPPPGNSVDAFSFFDNPQSAHAFKDSGQQTNSYKSQAQAGSEKPIPELPPPQDSVDDDWGDFETGEGWKETPGPTPGDQPLPKAAPSDLSQPQRIEHHLPTDPFQSSNDPFGFDEVGGTSTIPNKPPRTKLSNRAPRDPSVLFDADEDQSSSEAEDEFGAFEDAPPSSVPAPQSRPTAPKQEQTTVGDSLLDLDFGSTNAQVHESAPWQSESKVSSFRISAPSEADRFRGDAGRRAPKADPSSALADLAIDDSGGWGDFDEVFGSGSSAQNAKPSTTAKKPTTKDVHAKRKPAPAEPIQDASPAVEEDQAWDDFDTTIPSDSNHRSPKNLPSSTLLPHLPTFLPDPANPPSLPPTNVPPPSLVLSLFPPLIETAQSSFFQPYTALSASSKNVALSEPSPQAFLKSYIQLGFVGARIIAGRKLRWKRDARLSQGMRIGAAGGKGMKLAGIDRAEVAREEREVADLLRAWNAQVGKLRTVVAPANNIMTKAAAAATGFSAGQQPPLGRVPDLTASQGVKTATEAEGAVPAELQLCRASANAWARSVTKAHPLAVQVHVVALGVGQEVGGALGERDDRRPVAAEVEVQHAAAAQDGEEVLVGGAVGQVRDEDGALVLSGRGRRRCGVTRTLALGFHHARLGEGAGRGPAVDGRPGAQVAGADSGLRGGRGIAVDLGGGDEDGLPVVAPGYRDGLPGGMIRAAVLVCAGREQDLEAAGVKTASDEDVAESALCCCQVLWLLQSSSRYLVQYSRLICCCFFSGCVSAWPYWLMYTNEPVGCIRPWGPPRRRCP